MSSEGQAKRQATVTALAQRSCCEETGYRGGCRKRDLESILSVDIPHVALLHKRNRLDGDARGRRRGGVESGEIVGVNQPTRALLSSVRSGRLPRRPTVLLPSNRHSLSLTTKSSCSLASTLASPLYQRELML